MPGIVATSQNQGRVRAPGPERRRDADQGEHCDQGHDHRQEVRRERLRRVHREDRDDRRIRDTDQAHREGPHVLPSIRVARRVQFGDEAPGGDMIYIGCIRKSIESGDD